MALDPDVMCKNIQKMQQDLDDAGYLLWFSTCYQQHLDTLQATWASRLVDGSLTYKVLKTHKGDKLETALQGFCVYITLLSQSDGGTDLPVDVSSGVSQPHQALGVSSKRRGVCRCLVEAAGHRVHLAPHLHQAHHALQLVTQPNTTRPWWWWWCFNSVFIVLSVVDLL